MWGAQGSSEGWADSNRRGVMVVLFCLGEDGLSGSAVREDEMIIALFVIFVSFGQLMAIRLQLFIRFLNNSSIN